MSSFIRIGLRAMLQSSPIIRPRRSLLFVPALRPDRYAKALDSGADIVCIDSVSASSSRPTRGWSVQSRLRSHQRGSIRSSSAPSPCPPTCAAKTIEKARKVRTAFEQDSSALVVVDGELIEPPVVRSMYRVLAIAERLKNAA